MATIEIRKDKRGQFRFSVKSRNGETIATSESYVQKAKALSTARSMASSLATARILDLTAPPIAPAKSSKAPKTTNKKTAKKAAKKAAKATKASTRKSKTTGLAKRSPTKPAPTSVPKSASRGVPSRSVAGGSTRSKSTPVKPALGGDRIDDQTVRTPATGRSPRITTPADDVREPMADDLDTVAVPEGADIVTPDQLGDGEGIADGITPVGGDDDTDEDETSQGQ